MFCVYLEISMRWKDEIDRQINYGRIQLQRK